MRVSLNQLVIFILAVFVIKIAVADQMGDKNEENTLKVTIRR